MTNYFVHESSYVDEDVGIGEGTKIWHFSHVMPRSRIGQNCNIGQNVSIASDVTVGDNVKIQNNVSVYTGVIIEDDVFLGPSMVFTNVINPRSHVPRRVEYRTTLVKQGASIGANATIVCGVTLGRYAFVGAGAVVTHDVPDYALVYGSPAKIHSWVCQCGLKLNWNSDGDNASNALSGNGISRQSASEAAGEAAFCESCGSCYTKQGEVVRETEKVTIA